MNEKMISNKAKPVDGIENNVILTPVLRAASWNIAAINNNPFEYWISNPNPDYESFMRSIQEFIQAEANDIPLNRIFTDDMFSQLCSEMEKQSIGGSDELSNFWINDFRNRLAISGFLKDKVLGLKRLASMPDRITNTINLSSGGTCMRPTVINAYDGGALESIDSWWKQWRKFMFYTTVQISTGKSTKAASSPLVVCKLLSPISRSKYPAITVEEQAASVPLQILCLALLDAIFVCMVNIVSPGSIWEGVRQELCKELIQNKSRKIQDILAKDYADMDVIFIQEAAAIFVQNLQEDIELHERFSVLLPWNVDGKRDQNSMILVRREKFRDSCSTDLTSTILDGIDGSWVAPGDLVAFSILDVTGRRWLLVSFHGDSNGLSTQPFMEALDTIARRSFEDHILVVGLDANTHTVPPDKYHHSVESFCTFITEHGMLSSWGETPDASLHTTCSARTFLQTQLNKAMSFENRLSQKSLKDWIVVYRHQSLAVSDAIRDNTGKQKFVEGLVLPSLQFPSDHAIVSASLSFPSSTSASKSLRIAPEAAWNSQDSFAVESEIIISRISAEENHSKPEAISNSSTRPKSPLSSPLQEKTLYDYWGIREKPVTEKIFASLKPSLTSCHSAHTMSLEQEISKICEDHYIQLVTNPRSEDLDTRRLIFSRIEDKSLWILFSSRPVSMTLCKSWGQILFISLAMQYLLEFTLNILAVVSVTGMQGSHFRFTSLMPRSGLAAAASNSSVHSLGLLMDGCIVTAPSNISASAPSVFLNFDRPVRFNGWCFTTSADPQSAGLDPVDFRFEASTDGSEWKEIKPPPWMRTDDYYRVPFERMSHKLVDLQPSWEWILFWCVGMLWMSLGMLVPSALGAKGRGRQAAIAESVAVSILGLLALVNGVYITFIARDLRDLDGILYWAMGLELLCLAWIFFTELYTVKLASPVFALFGITTYFEKQCHFPSPVSQISQYLPLVWTVMPSLAALVQNIARWFIRRWVFHTLIKQEKDLYDAVWAEILADDKEVGALEELRQCSERISARIKKGPILQLHPTDESSENDGSFSKHHPVRSLDRLFNQASALGPFLRHKTKQLALKSNGFLAVRAGDEHSSQIEFQLCQDIVFSQNLDRVQWAKLKPIERAVEKLVRCYDCEVSRLLDCCRQRIVFTQPRHIILCLEAIQKDEEVEIVRIKNRLDPCYNSYFSGGFRSIVINFRIQSRSTKRLGLDYHICELQLLLNLKQTAIMKCDDYHKHYLILRNCREGPSFSKFVSAVLASTYRSFLQSLIKSVHPIRPKDKGSETDCVGPTSHTSILSHDAIAHEGNSLLDDNEDTVIAETGSEKARIGASCKPASNVRSSSQRSISVFKADDTDCWLFLQRTFEKHFFLSMTSLTQYCGPGYNKSKVLEDAIAQTPISAVWDTSHPFAAALCKPWIWVLSLVFFASITFNLSIGVNLILRNGLITGNSLRFTAVDHMHGAGTGIRSLGFLRDGCSYLSRSVTQSEVISDQTYSVSYADGFSMNGWWFSIPLDSIERMPRRFFVEISKGGATDSWKKVGSSSYLWTWSGSVVFFDGNFHISGSSQQVKTYIKDQEMVVEFDMRLPWIWCYAKWLTSIALILMTLSAIIASHTKNQMRGRVVCAFFWFVLHVLEILVCIGYTCTGEKALAILSGIYSCSDLIYALMLAYFENTFRQLNGLCGALYVGAVIAHYFYLDVPHLIIGEYFGFENRGLFEGVGLLMLSLSGYFFRSQSRRRAEQVMAEFHLAYDNCWEGILEFESASQSDTIKEMIEFTDSITKGLTYPARQRGKGVWGHEQGHADQEVTLLSGASLCKKRIKSTLFNFLRSPLAFCGGAHLARIDPGPLILDLDQLFAQADGVDLLLQLKVQQWALLSNGYFPVVSSAGAVVFEPWEKIAGSDEMLAMVKWGRIKSRKRAIEKLYRSYNCDVSRLLDCCRQSIYFENLKDLLSCMKAIATDPESKIVRVKNRLRPDFDASSTAGFRNVALNLQVLTHETRKLRIETHICEVQLVTVDFGKLKTEAGHQRYVSWRNLKGE